MSTVLIEKLLDPKSIVVIGASAREGSPGFALTRNIIEGGYQGDLYLVNPRYNEVLDQPCYRSVKSLPETPELAILITPARILRKTLVQCSRKGAHVAVVMSGTENSQSLHRYARRLGMRLMGPYCAGLIRPHLSLNATYSSNKIYKGNLALLTQSAALGSAIVDWAQNSNVGFSALLSTGQDTDIRLADLIDLLAEDWHTKAIIVYVDRVESSRSFLSALSAAARIKPVVLMHSSYDGVRYCDALSRTGQVYNSDKVFQAALNRAGVVRIRTFSNLYAAARILSTRIRVCGNRLAIVSNANAPAMLAMQRMFDKEFLVPSIEESSLKALKKRHKVQLTGTNPVLLRNPSSLAQDYQSCIDYLQGSDEFDAILVIFVPDARNDPELVANAVSQSVSRKKPLLSCWMGDASVLEARKILSTADIPVFRTPEEATDGFDFLHRYHVSQQQLLQLPNPASRSTPADAQGANKLIKARLTENERVLDPEHTRQLMQLFDIPVLHGKLAHSLGQAIESASQIGFPVAMKLVSTDISYKAAIVSTQLNLTTENAIKKAWHLCESSLKQKRPDAQFGGVFIEAMHAPTNPRYMRVSIARDPVFGPVISMGVGGELTALMHNRQVQLPPLNRYLISEILDNRELQIYLGAFRHNQAVRAEPLSNILRRLSELACELPEVFSLDINPLVLSDDGAIAMDVHVVLEKPASTQRYKHLAIHPYPWQWVRDETLKDGSKVQLRPIRPEDAEALQDMVKNMSSEARYFRFMHAINELSPQMMAQFTKLDYDRQMAFVATDDTLKLSQGAAQTVLGISRYMITNNRLTGEFAISVRDDAGGKGLATKLMSILIEQARSQGLKTIFGEVLRTNKPMQALMQSMSFSAKASRDDHEILIYTLEL